jgi:hypothetical protein
LLRVCKKPVYKPFLRGIIVIGSSTKEQALSLLRSATQSTYIHLGKFVFLRTKNIIVFSCIFAGGIGMRVEPVLRLFLILGATASSSLAGLCVWASDRNESVQELASDLWRAAPIDYGLGPYRGKPTAYFTEDARFKPASARATAAQPAVNPLGGIANITIKQGGAYTTWPTCTISAPTVVGGKQAYCTVTALAAMPQATPNFTPGGGYLVGDTLTMNPMSGMTCSIFPTVTVTAVDSQGGITAVSPLTAGVCSAIPSTGAYSFSGGKGSGYTMPTGPLGLLWRALFAVSSGGSGYRSNPSVTFSSAPQGGATGSAFAAPLTASAVTVPAGGPTAAIQGVFGHPAMWPINAIHLALLPDGRVLSYGSDQFGAQTGELLYDVWDPSLGLGQGAHLVLPNTTSTDIFCSGTSIDWTNGQVLLAGGDLTVNGSRNYASNKTTLFNPSANALGPGPQMKYPRWYGSLVPLPSGAKLVLGGYATRSSEPNSTATTPEVYSAATGWSTLSSATNSQTHPYYPKAFVTPAGNVIDVTSNGGPYSISISGAGTSQSYKLNLQTATGRMAAVMYAPGKILSVRSSSVILIDVNGAKPVVTQAASLDQIRSDASATLLADGEVLVNGGSLISNILAGAAYTTQLWSPSTGTWTTGASAGRARLYHGNALLLPDATVLTAGGGSPGPIVNLNAEIYYPSYLYKNDGSGSPAPRPVITSLQAPATGLPVGQTLGITMADTSPVSRVTLVRYGAATHSTNLEQRFFDLTSTMTQTGQQLVVTTPSNANVLMPGYYMVFAFNQAGVPSVSQTVLITP